MNTVSESLHRCFAKAMLTLMCPLLVAFNQPLVKVILQLVYTAIKLLAECHTVKLILHGSMHLFTYTIGLRAPYLRFCMLSQYKPVPSYLSLQCLYNRFLKVSRSWRSHTERRANTSRCNIMPPLLEQIGDKVKVVFLSFPSCFLWLFKDRSGHLVFQFRLTL